MTLIPKYSNSHALVVGINAYKSAPPLGYAVNDAVAIAAALSGRFLFPKEKVRLLLDSDATRSAILNHVLSFACDGTEVNDRLVVFFAGHGHTVKSLAPYRECRGRKTSYKRKRIRAAALSIGAT